MFKALLNAPFSMRLLLIAFVLLTASLFTAYGLLSNSSKYICNIDDADSSKTSDNIQPTQTQLDSLCGKPVKVNTFKDTSIVFLIAGLVISILIWLFLAGILMKSQFWDCMFNHNCEGVQDIYWFYAIGVTFILLFLLPTFIIITKKQARTCGNAASKNCTLTKHNSSNISLILFCCIGFLILTISLLLFLIFFPQ